MGERKYRQRYVWPHNQLLNDTILTSDVKKVRLKYNRSSNNINNKDNNKEVKNKQNKLRKKIKKNLLKKKWHEQNKMAVLCITPNIEKREAILLAPNKR